MNPLRLMYVGLALSFLGVFLILLGETHIVFAVIGAGISGVGVVTMAIITGIAVGPIPTTKQEDDLE